MPKENDIHFTIVIYGSAAYEEAVLLREVILRRPHGLNFSKEELEKEKEDIHIAGYIGNILCATLALVIDKNSLKMQRVAVAVNFQNKGIESLLLKFCEEYAKENKYASIYCLARGTAIQFYRKNGYTLEGETFEEDGIPHHKMRKGIT